MLPTESVTGAAAVLLSASVPEPVSPPRVAAVSESEAKASRWRRVERAVLQGKRIAQGERAAGNRRAARVRVAVGERDYAAAGLEQRARSADGRGKGLGIGVIEDQGRVGGGQAHAAVLPLIEAPLPELSVPPLTAVGPEYVLLPLSASTPRTVLGESVTGAIVADGAAEGQRAAAKVDRGSVCPGSRRPRQVQGIAAGEDKIGVPSDGVAGQGQRADASVVDRTAVDRERAISARRSSALPARPNWRC